MPKNKFNFDELKNVIKEIRNDLPTKLANATENYFSKSFTNQSWEGKSWQEVQRRIPGTIPYKYPKKKDLARRTRPILIGKGSTKLRRAVNNSVRVNVWPRVLLVVDLPYAKRHNEGSDGMPKRQFMGDSDGLRNMQQKIIQKYMNKLKRL